MILTPLMKCRGAPRRLGLCCPVAHLLATADLSPALKRWGPSKRHGLCSHPAHLRASSNFVPRYEVLGTP